MLRRASGPEIGLPPGVRLAPPVADGRYPLPVRLPRAKHRGQGVRELYQEPDPRRLDERRHSRARRRALDQLHALGYAVTLTEEAA
jgi:hypothetical protein